MKFLIICNPERQKEIIKDLDATKTQIDKMLNSRKVKIASFFTKRIGLPIMVALSYKVLSPREIELTIAMSAERFIRKSQIKDTVFKNLELKSGETVEILR